MRKTSLIKRQKLKAVATGMCVLVACGAYLWSAIAICVTLAGGEERALVGGGALEYAKLFAWYLLGPTMPGASIGFWLGTIAIIAAFALSIGMRRSK